MVGTIRYCSLNSHLGIEQTRRDDLESLFYLLIYMVKGTLPWQGLSVTHKFEKDYTIMNYKLKTDPEQFCSDLPSEMTELFEYIKSLDFYETPDYRYIIN